MESPKPDDPSIRNEDELLRRIPPWQVENDGSPSPAAFKAKTPELSVNVARLTTPQKTMEEVAHRDDFQLWKLASFLAQVAREAQLKVYMDPLPSNPAHAIVFGEKELRVRRRLAQACRIVPW